MKKSRSDNLIFALVLAIAITMGCNKTKDTTPVSAPKVDAKADPKQPTVPVQKQLTAARLPSVMAPTYDFKNKKDPFKPFITQPEPTKGLPPKRSPSGDGLPIQSHEVTKFTVSGIITGLKENKALVIDPAGKGYVVRVGMLIGINGGHVSHISPSSIEVTEKYIDEKKHIKTRNIVLPLAKKSKEIPR